MKLFFNLICNSSINNFTLSWRDIMIIGCPTEIKNQEYRVGITPAAAAEATLRGHKVLIQSGAGNGSGFY